MFSFQSIAFNPFHLEALFEAPCYHSRYERLFEPQFDLDLNQLLFQPCRTYSICIASEPVFERSYYPVFDLGNVSERCFYPSLFDSCFMNDHYEQDSNNEFDDEALLRNQLNLPAEGEFYTAVVQRSNEARHQNAVAQNQDGGEFFKEVIRDHLSSLSVAERTKFKEAMQDCDPDIFVKLPELAVKKAISSHNPLTRKNLPAFLHPHLIALEKMRKQKQTGRLRNEQAEVGRIATALHRDTNCIASMQRAIQASA